jgi:hypothetical protein
MKHKRFFEYQITEFFLSQIIMLPEMPKKSNTFALFYVLVVTIKLFLAFTH